MRDKGFGSHSLMGALFLGSVWLAIYFADLLAMFSRDDGLHWLAIAAGLAGVIGGPLTLVLTEGDEAFGFFGVLVALALGWLSAWLATLSHASAEAINAIRLGAAALGPIIFYLAIRVMIKIQERRRVREL